MKSYFLLFAILMSGLSLNAQKGYDFEIMQSDDNKLSAIAPSIKINENMDISIIFTTVIEDNHLLLLFHFEPKDFMGKFDLTRLHLLPIEVEGCYPSLSILLSNGETFHCPYAESAEDSWGCLVENLVSDRNLKITNTNSYAMTQFRKYNIEKISIDYWMDLEDGIPLELEDEKYEVKTSDFHSALTIDAMCKGLIAKTGDDGQYGSAPSKTTTNSISRNNPRTTRR